MYPATKQRVAPGFGISRPALWISDGRYSFLVAALVWLLLILGIVPDSFDYRDLTGGGPAAASPLFRSLWLGLIAVSAVLIIWRANLCWLLLIHLNVFLWLIVGLALLSMAWSPEPEVTVRRCLRLGAILMVALACVLVSWHERRFQNLLRPVFTLMLLGSLIFALIAPELAVHQAADGNLGGSLRGLTNHKNTLGVLAGLSLLLWAHAGLSGEAGWRRVLPGSALAILCLLLAHSATALVTTLFSLLFLIFILRAPLALRPYLPFFISILTIAIVTYAIAVLRLVPGLEFLLKPIVMITGKDLTFTGRSDIWAIVGEQIAVHPWLGGGYGAYWIPPTLNAPVHAFIARMYFYPGSAHNGYLDVLNDLGYAGLTCLLGYLVFLLIQGLRMLGIQREQGALFLTLLVHQAVTNFSESHWFNSLSLGFIVMTLATTALARLRLEQRLQQAFGAPPQSRQGHVAWERLHESS